MKVFAAVILSFTFLAIVSTPTQADEWVSLFDGKTTAGWRANEKPDCFTVENGELKLNGGMAHLFCVRDGFSDLINFEFKVDVKTLPGANSGIFFHTDRATRDGVLHNGGDEVFANLRARCAADSKGELFPMSRRG